MGKIGRGLGRGGSPQGLGQEEKRGKGGPPNICKCSNPDCDYEIKKERGTPCLSMGECPKCKSPLIGAR